MSLNDDRIFTASMLIFLIVGIVLVAVPMYLAVRWD